MIGAKEMVKPFALYSTDPGSNSKHYIWSPKHCKQWSLSRARNEPWASQDIVILISQKYSWYVDVYFLIDSLIIINTKSATFCMLSKSQLSRAMAAHIPKGGTSGNNYERLPAIKVIFFFFATFNSSYKVDTKYLVCIKCFVCIQFSQKPLRWTTTIISLQLSKLKSKDLNHLLNVIRLVEEAESWTSN